MKLKTLKELRWDRDLDGRTLLSYDGWDVSAEQLKQEAIKWIKYHSNILKESTWKTDKIFVRGKIDVLKSFFNITEEDLNGVH